MAQVAEGRGQNKAVRKHIYQQQSEREWARSRTCPRISLRKAWTIVHGRQPVVPAEARTYGRGGASYVRPQDAPHPYLKRMAFQKGGYAIFMAFKTSGKTRMGKREIINRAQPYSTEDMASDFFAGRLFAGWKSIDSLEKHEFVQRTGNVWTRQAHQCDEFTLTAAGAAFIPKMIAKFGDRKVGGGGGGGGVASAGAVGAGDAFAFGHGDHGGHGHHGATAAATAAAPPRAPSRGGRRVAKQHAAEVELLRWLRAPERHNGEFKQLNVAKHVRYHLHKLIDWLVDTEGWLISRESAGDGRHRIMTVVLNGRPPSFAASAAAAAAANSSSLSSSRKRPSSKTSNHTSASKAARWVDDEEDGDLFFASNTPVSSSNTPGGFRMSSSGNLNMSAAEAARTAALARCEKAKPPRVDVDLSGGGIGEKRKHSASELSCNGGMERTPLFR